MIDENVKMQLIRVALEYALVEKGLPDREILVDPTMVIVSLENIDRHWLPQLPGISLIPLDHKKIIAKAETEGDFVYLLIYDFLENDQGFQVSLNSNMAISSENIYQKGGGFTLKCTLVDGFLKKETLKSWLN